jgi:hypothetical protein
MDVDYGVVGVSGSGVADGVHDDFVVRVMVSPNQWLAEEVGKGWIRVGHADAGAKVNKTILVESSQDRQSEDCEHGEVLQLFGRFLLFNCSLNSGWSWLFYWWYGGIGKRSGVGSLPGCVRSFWEGVVLVDKEVAVFGVFRGLGVFAQCSVLLAKILRTSMGVQFLCWVAVQSFKSHLGVDL